MVGQDTVFSKRFAGRRALVTGGASGIGLSVATRLAREGAAVCLWDANRDALAAARKAINPDVVTMPVDVTDWSTVDEAAIRLRERFGGIDVLVCSAGITGPNVPLWDYTNLH